MVMNSTVLLSLKKIETIQFFFWKMWSKQTLFFIVFFLGLCFVEATNAWFILSWCLTVTTTGESVILTVTHQRYFHTYPRDVYFLQKIPPPLLKILFFLRSLIWFAWSEQKTSPGLISLFWGKKYFVS